MKTIHLLFITVLFTSCSTFPGNGNASGYSNGEKSEIRQLIGDIKTTFTQNNMYNKSLFIHNGLDIIYFPNSDSSVNTSFVNSLDGVIQTNTYEGRYHIDTFRRDSLHRILRHINDESSSCFIGTIETNPSESFLDSFYIWNSTLGYRTSTAANEQYNTIPPKHPHNLDSIHNYTVFSPRDAKNFLMLSGHKTIELSGTGELSITGVLSDSYHDIVIINPEVTANSERRMITHLELEELKQKPNGSRRLVFCTLNLTTVDKRSLIWKDEWNYELPQWLILDGYSSYRIDFHNDWYEWRETLTGSDSYIEQLRKAEFDGIVLTVE